jgi:hypothetical protein
MTGRGPWVTFSHLCPVPRCPERVDRMFCRGHWRLVSWALRGLLWRTWASGYGAGSAEHVSAALAAITEAAREAA